MFLYAITKEEDSYNIEYAINLSPEKISECPECKRPNYISNWDQKSIDFDHTTHLNGFYDEYIDLSPYVEVWNIDSNIPVKGLQALNNLKGWQVHDVIKRTLDKILIDRGSLDTQKSFNFDRKYNELDGSYKVKEAIDFLNKLRSDCNRYNTFVVEVHFWNY